MEEFNLIREWAEAKGIAKGGDLKTQSLKLMEEVGELAKAVLTNNTPEIVDAIGDCVVVLTNLAMLANREYMAGNLPFDEDVNEVLRHNNDLRAISIESCIASAYNVIKSRTGKMVDGSFVKDVNAFDHATNTASKMIEHYGKEAIDGEELVESYKPCCDKEDRSINGGCKNCGDPSF